MDPEVKLSPSPIRRVFEGRNQVLGMTIGPGGSRIVDGGGLVIPAHGLSLQVMLVPVLPGRPRASMTAPVGGMMWFEGFRMKPSTAQKFVFDPPNMLASKKAEEPTGEVPDELYTAFCPWLGALCAIDNSG